MIYLIPTFAENVYLKTEPKTEETGFSRIGPLSDPGRDLLHSLKTHSGIKYFITITFGHQ